MLLRQKPRIAPELEVVHPASCLQCGAVAPAGVSFCRRCGIPFGAPPRADAQLPECPVCYQEAADDGLLPSLAQHGRRVPISLHLSEHERFPVGDDEFLESLREGDRVRIGRWHAPFDLVRRYLVTGALSGGRRRAMEHNLIVTAMSQLARFGPEASIIGDQEQWRHARDAVTVLMERYHRA